MKPTKTLIVCALAGGLAWAQSPSVVQNTRNTMNAVSNHATAASNQALGVAQTGDHPVTSTAVSATSATKSTATPSSTGAKSTRKAKKASVAAPRHSVQVKTGAAEVPKTVASGTPILAGNGATPSAEGESASEQPVTPDSKSSANGRRDPFISPVVSHATGSGCSTGKKCLEIGTLNLRGVVHGESGFIAVVSNSMNKAYFLRENDPVFNGYVIRITGDSIVFQETLQDRMGKNFTREVVKKITAPAV